VKAGRLKALATTGAQRSVLFPELPTIAESGLPGYEADSSHSLFAPHQTPRNVIARLYDEATRALRQNELKERFAVEGVEPVGGTPEQLAATMAADMQKVGKLIKEAGIRTD